MRSVFITGTSTGIGRATALRLDAHGWRVFAGYRDEQDAVSLRDDASSNLTPVQVDITDEGSIRTAAEKVMADTGHRLNGLVNNAGITVQAPLEYLPLDDLRRQLEVNVIGQVACTQVLLPALRAAKGRIVFVSSVQGRARSLPLLGPYCASKWALEALADSWRIELHQSDMKVSIVEPGTIDTPIWDKTGEAFERILADLPPEGRQRYERLVERGIDLAEAATTIGVSPERVAKKIQHALASRRPRNRYTIGDALPRILLETPLPDFVRDRVISNVLTR